FTKEDTQIHTIKLKNGLNLKVNKSSGDLTTLFEVFIDEDYKFNFKNSYINILDIGANVGYFSLYAAKKFPKAMIFAFEPFPDTFQRLNEHIKLNSIDNVKTFNY